MTIAVDWDVKQQNKQTKLNYSDKYHRCGQIVHTQIRLLLKEQSDQR